ncbi:hypothetical protein BDK51DRAFT_38302 [Blyttiomyces helicus]|uniref:Uncharacterized protein n=1 Tax=Blyttiomyces helicus TaxID=388810 RepID=A0A4V1IQL3_9FUNG|nr:hypothetical protein BDK51DRAFT_38302 [Blyttiomyces helicus]|eukprot:RKO86957.1 hypothetical protein BDK51DRAFT_38302 [Blyttiomyces helicus]
MSFTAAARAQGVGEGLPTKKRKRTDEDTAAPHDDGCDNATANPRVQPLRQVLADAPADTPSPALPFIPDNTMPGPRVPLPHGKAINAEDPHSAQDEDSDDDSDDDGSSSDDSCSSTPVSDRMLKAIAKIRADVLNGLIPHFSPSVSCSRPWLTYVPAARPNPPFVLPAKRRKQTRAPPSPPPVASLPQNTARLSSPPAAQAALPPQAPLSPRHSPNRDATFVTLSLPHPVTLDRPASLPRVASQPRDAPSPPPSRVDEPLSAPAREQEPDDLVADNGPPADEPGPPDPDLGADIDAMIEDDGTVGGEGEEGEEEGEMEEEEENRFEPYDPYDTQMDLDESDSPQLLSVVDEASKEAQSYDGSPGEDAPPGLVLKLDIASSDTRDEVAAQVEAEAPLGVGAGAAVEERVEFAMEEMEKGAVGGEGEVAMEINANAVRVNEDFPAIPKGPAEEMLEANRPAIEPPVAEEIDPRNLKPPAPIAPSRSSSAGAHHIETALRKTPASVVQSPIPLPPGITPHAATSVLRRPIISSAQSKFTPGNAAAVATPSANSAFSANSPRVLTSQKKKRDVFDFPESDDESSQEKVHSVGTHPLPFTERTPKPRTLWKYHPQRVCNGAALERPAPQPAPPRPPPRPAPNGPHRPLAPAHHLSHPATHPPLRSQR